MSEFDEFFSSPDEKKPIKKELPKIIPKQPEIPKMVTPKIETTKKISEKKKPFTFTNFSQFMLSRAKKSGSNSLKIGEIAFRKTSLKNIYLTILMLREENML